MAETLDLALFVQRRDGTAHMDLAVENVACAACIRKIESSVKRLPGVVDVYPRPCKREPICLCR